MRTLAVLGKGRCFRFREGFSGMIQWIKSKTTRVMQVRCQVHGVSLPQDLAKRVTSSVKRSSRDVSHIFARWSHHVLSWLAMPAEIAKACIVLVMILNHTKINS